MIEGHPGNSGIGVLTIGAGQRQYRNIVRVNQEIANGTFEKNDTLQEILKEVTEGNNTIHLIGSITDSMDQWYFLLSLYSFIHSHMSHIYALLKCCKEAGVKNCYIHGLLDGEDTENGKYV